MHILIIGTGYVGLVSGACFAQKGHHVICLDIDEEKIRLLKQGIPYFYEPGLEELIQNNSASNRLAFTTCYKEAIQQADIAFICTPTPPQKDGSADLSFVAASIHSLAKSLDHPMLIAIKSTVPPGTGKKMEDLMEKLLQEAQKTIPVTIVANPEFLREGCAVHDCLNPDRVIVGTNSSRAKDILKSIYEPFGLRQEQLIFMDRCSAETTKYAANAMLATRISFMNELSLICDKVGANIDSIRLGIGSDKRIGPDFLQAGIGFGGSCFPKDLKALQALAKSQGVNTPLLQAVETINENQKKYLVEKIADYFALEGGLKNKTIGIWGLSFKPNTDDIREAPSLALIHQLLDQGAILKLFDPVAIPQVRKHFLNHEKIEFCQTPYEACQEVEALALVTEWKLFREIDLNKTLDLMKGNAFFDGRNQYSSEDMHDKGFNYFGVGVPAQTV